MRIRIMDTYSKEYTLFKPDKRLRWLPQLGTVDLAIELKDRTVEVQVPPLEAAIIELFSEKGLCLTFRSSDLTANQYLRAFPTDEWTVDDLSKALQADATSIRKANLTWLEHGVLREKDSSGLAYVVVEESSAEGVVPGGSGRNVAQRQGTLVLRNYVKEQMLTMQSASSASGVVEEQEAPVSSAQQQEAEQMRVYWRVRYLSYASPTSHHSSLSHAFRSLLLIWPSDHAPFRQLISSSKACSPTSGRYRSIVSRRCSSLRRDIRAQSNSWVRSWRRRGEKASLQSVGACGS